MAKHERTLPKTYGDLIKFLVRETIADAISVGILIPFILIAVYVLKVVQFTYFGY